LANFPRFSRNLRALMSQPASTPSVEPKPLQVDLKNPGLAALLAWLWPGAGHLYQGRTAKGILFMVCILGTYFYGFAIGQGHVVYASWRAEDWRLPYVCQVGVGLPALPAMVQAWLVKQGKPPLLGSDIMTPPDVDPNWGPERKPDTLSRWHQQAGKNFELGTLFTMVAGLLNILAIYDAFAGPVPPAPDEKRRRPENSGDKKDSDPVEKKT
jgi:hypothetical protein